MISAAFCIACASAPSVAPSGTAAGSAPPVAAPADQVARLYNDYRHRLPCPEQVICGRGPDVPVVAARCRPSPAPAEARCIFLLSIPGPATDRIYRCEGAFDRLDGTWWMSELVDDCALASERAQVRFRQTEVPGRRTIEEIESGHALREDLLAGRIADREAANAGPRVRVRGVACYPWDGEAHCSYEASRCLEGERDRNGDGWCRRSARFLFGIGDHLTIVRGWAMDRDPGER
ncbi:MAG: hypothetical protein ACXWUQ_02810 [Allosphingosinicella sp.]